MALQAVRGVPGLCLTKGAGEIRKGLEALVASYEAKVDALVAAAPAGAGGFAATFARLADADGHAALASTELTLPALVSGDADARAASSEAKKRLQQMWSKAYARTDLYKCLDAARSGANTSEEERLVRQVMGKLRQAGAALPGAETRAEVSALDARCAAIALEIEQNINEDTTAVQLSDSDLVGCNDDFIQSLPLAEGAEAPRRLCSVKAPVLLPILKRAACGETRRKMVEASQQRCMAKNGPLLDELFAKRHAAATGLGFTSHAERMLSSKMAGTPQEAERFCRDMLARISPLRSRDMERLLARKKSDQGRKRKLSACREGTEEAEDSCELQAWDVAFYSDLLKQEELSFDDEKVKEFFPLEGTIERLLAIYSSLLGLEFHRSDALPLWHEEVVAFEVRNKGEVVGHLYLDQFPRDGKYGHQMILPLSPSFVDSTTGVRCVPACVNISNLPRPQGWKPALLRFAEMQTLFHELGHAMHCLCTTTRFSLLSWAWPMVPWPGGVEQDFLEVPSMALEKLACEPELLAKVSQHYSGKADAPKLEDATISTIKALEKWMVGVSQSKYFAMALFDLQVHAQAPPYSLDGENNLSAQQLFARMLEKYTGLKQLPDTHFCASWYHPVTGYDAGYYGYGWSDVYAADIFGAMLTRGLLSAETGQKLRDDILGPCATRPGDELLRAFLGREPSADAWCERNGVPLSGVS